MKKEICHVCKKVKKPYVMFVTNDPISIIQYEMAREPGPICERCNKYYAMTGLFKDATEEEFIKAKEATKFAIDMLKWWFKDKDDINEADIDKREWPGTVALVKWYISKKGKNNGDI